MPRIVQVIQPSGKIDNQKIALLNQEIVNFIEQNISLILLDFRDSTSITAEGVLALYDVCQLIQAQESNLYVCSLSPSVKQVFEQVKLLEAFAPLASRREFEEIILACG